MIGKIVRAGSLALMLSQLLLLASIAPVSAQEGETGYTVQVVQTDTSRFPEVDVWVSVTDSEGNPVSTLPDSAFTLIENGQPIEIGEVYQAGEQGPVNVVLAIDRSGSMNDIGKLEAAKAAATTFIDLMRPEDVTGIIAFNTQVGIIQPITGDKATLRDGIAGLQAFDDTAMYDALAASIEMLGNIEGRRAIIILSDGLDNRSQRTADDILDGIEQAEISIYAIGLGDPSLGTASTAGIDEAALRAIADRSRGMYTYQPDPEGLSGLYQQLSRRLQNEYRLTYVSPNTLHDGVERAVEVQVAEASGVQTGYNPGGVIPETAQALGWPLFGAAMAGLIVLLIVPGLLRRVSGVGKIGARQRRKGRVKLTDSKTDTGHAGKPQAKGSRVRLLD